LTQASMATFTSICGGDTEIAVGKNGMA